MADRKGLVTAGAALAAASILGAGLALSGAWALGGFEGGTTTVREIASGGSFPSQSFVKETKPLSINEIYTRSAPGVVQITSTSTTRAVDPFFGFPFQRQQQALGSGFVLDKSGHIVTNYHVIQGAQSIEVSFSNNDSMKARVVGRDQSTDLAVLKVDAAARALTPLSLGDSDKVEVGDAVLAIGNPFGLNRSATAGIVSAVDRPLSSPNGFAIDDVIQTDAQINQGNSGGPLINARGNVIGVNTAIETGNTGASGNIGIGFAVPVNTVRTVTAQLIRNGKVEHPFLGVEARPITRELSRVVRLSVTRGLLVAKVAPGSSADRAGLKAGSTRVVLQGETYILGGDVLVKADGIALTATEQLRKLIAQKRPGDKITLEVNRNGKKRTVTVKLGRQPATSSARSSVGP